jgi:hypothetical protein
MIAFAEQEFDHGLPGIGALRKRAAFVGGR